MNKHVLLDKLIKERNLAQIAYEFRIRDGSSEKLVHQAIGRLECINVLLKELGFSEEKDYIVIAENVNLLGYQFLTNLAHIKEVK